MHRIFIIFFVALLAPPSLWAAEPLLLKPTELTFRFGYEDGTEVWPCTHKLANDTGTDWVVVCQLPRNTTQEFGVHLVIKQFDHPTDSDRAYQILYSVANRKDPRRTKFFGGSSWLHLGRAAPIKQVTLSQIVEKGIKELRVTFAVR